jgi:hypothetical protein
MKHSLRERYNHFNRRVFDNVLPSKFRVAWINIPTHELGIIDYIITSHGRKNAQIPSDSLESGDWDYRITSLRVGRHENQLTDDERDALLLHEMIHVKMLQDRTQKFQPHRSELVGYMMIGFVSWQRHTPKEVELLSRSQLQIGCEGIWQSTFTFADSSCYCSRSPHSPLCRVRLGLRPSPTQRYRAWISTFQPVSRREAWRRYSEPTCQPQRLPQHHPG